MGRDVRTDFYFYIYNFIKSVRTSLPFSFLIFPCKINNFLFFFPKLLISFYFTWVSLVSIINFSNMLSHLLIFVFNIFGRCSLCLFSSSKNSALLFFGIVILTSFQTSIPLIMYIPSPLRFPFDLLTTVTPKVFFRKVFRSWTIAFLSVSSSISYSFQSLLSKLPDNKLILW